MRVYLSPYVGTQLSLEIRFIMVHRGTMTSYGSAKIYKLVNSEDDEIYVGSTCGTLRRRKSGHKSDAKKHPNQRVYAHLNAVGWENVRIILVEAVDCENRDELRRHEQHWIEILRPGLNRHPASVPPCPHNRRRQRCRDCEGSSICEHNRRKHDCRDCGGSQICEHDRRRSRCRDCGGSQICKHNKHKHICRLCGGSGFCEHDRYRQTCKDCYPVHCDYCDTTYSRGTIFKHYRTARHLCNWSAAYVDVYGEQPTSFPFHQLYH